MIWKTYWIDWTTECAHLERSEVPDGHDVFEVIEMGAVIELKELLSEKNMLYLDLANENERLRKILNDYEALEKMVEIVETINIKALLNPSDQ